MTAKYSHKQPAAGITDSSQGYFVDCQSLPRDSLNNNPTGLIPQSLNSFSFFLSSEGTPCEQYRVQRAATGDWRLDTTEITEIF